MLIYVHLTDQCIEDAKRHGVLESLSRFVDTVRSTQSIENLDKFPPPVLKKVIGKQHRALFAEWDSPNGDEKLLVGARLLIRGDNEYSKFKDSPAAYIGRFTPPDSTLADILGKLRQDPPRRAMPLGEKEKELLYWRFQGDSPGHGEMFLESDFWCRQIQNRAFANQKVRLAELLLQIASGTSNFSSSSGIKYSSHDTKSNLTVAWWKRADSRDVYLLAPLLGADPKAELSDQLADGSLSTFVKYLENEQHNDEMLRRFCRRAYEKTIVADEELWARIQDDIDSNLALSGEEAEILSTIRNPEEGDKRFPLFINGRPGSGKSTLLQYLFADYLNQWLLSGGSDETLCAPLYVTWSDELLTVAHDRVKQLLDCGAGLRLHSQSGMTPSSIRRHFKSFRDLLLSRLGSGLETEFDPNMYTRYSDFEKLWNLRHQKLGKIGRKIGPALLWHTIRTYIKGMRDEYGTFLDPDAYRDLPEQLKSVSQENYEIVYEDAFEKWYHPLNESGAWDDQDLAWQARWGENAKAVTHYSTIFCDESQDFTRIELEVVLDSSLYNHRALQPYFLRDIPFAFAGDPNQTINPTGFNWSAMMALFHDNIIRNLDKRARPSLELNFAELLNNYRSGGRIVKFCNSIQLARGVCLHETDFTPQKPWFTDDVTSTVTYFSVGADATLNALKQNTDHIIIVPCLDNNEQEFVETDDLLSSVALSHEHDGKKRITRTVLSASRAKGLDFKSVILFKFGDFCLREQSKGSELADALSQLAPMNTDNDEQLLESKYFLNRLYVAASRARKHVFIVDTDEAIQHFWGFLTDKSNDSLVNHANSIEAWESDDITRIWAGDVENWTGTAEAPEIVAERFEKQAMESRDSLLWQYAETNYKKAGREAKASYCRATAYECEKQWQSAAAIWKTLGDFNRALDCMWNAQAWRDIKDLGSDDAHTLNDNSRIVAASFMLNTCDEHLQESILKNILAFVTSDKWFSVAGDTIWRSIFAELVKAVFSRIDTCSVDESARLAKAFIKLIKNGFGPNDVALPIAEIAVKGQLYDEAKALLDTCLLTGQTFTANWIIECYAKTTSFPDNLEWYKRARLWSEIRSEWMSNQGIKPLRLDQLEILLEALIELGNFEDVFQLLNKHRSEELFVNALDRTLALGADRSEEAYLIAQRLLEFYVKAGQFDRAIQLTSGSLGAAVSDWRSKKKRRLQPVKLRQSLLHLLSESDELSSLTKLDENADVRSRVSDTIWSWVKQADTFINYRELPFQSVGYALERAGTHRYALEFYEMVYNGQYAKLSLTENERVHAKERWVVCKLRQADTERQDQIRRAKLSEEAKRKAREWKIAIPKDLTTYPEAVSSVKKSVGVSAEHVSVKVPSLFMPIPRTILKPEPFGGSPSGPTTNALSNFATDYIRQSIQHKNANVKERIDTSNRQHNEIEGLKPTSFARLNGILQGRTELDILLDFDERCLELRPVGKARPMLSIDVMSENPVTTMRASAIKEGDNSWTVAELGIKVTIERGNPSIVSILYFEAAEATVAKFAL